MKQSKMITALDIGSSKVTVVITQVTDTTAEVVGVTSIPSKGIKKGIIVNLDEAVNTIAQVITSAERMADVTVSNLIVNISGKSIRSRNNQGVVSVSTHGEVTSEDVWRAVETATTIAIPHGEEILHIIPREFIIDSQGGIRVPVGMSGNRLEVDTHLVLVPSTIKKNILKCITHQLGIEVDGVYFNALVDASAVLTDTEKELGIALLDIGAGTTDIILFQEGSVTYCGSIPVGGANVTNDLAVGLHISLEDAERLKLKYRELLDKPVSQASIDVPSFQKAERKAQKKDNAISKKEINDDLDISSLNIDGVKVISRSLLEKIVSVRVEEIFELAKQEVQRAGFDLAMPAGMVIVGGSAKLSGMTGFAKNIINVNARVGTPHGLSGMIEEINQPEFATVQGLVLYAVQTEESLSTVSMSSSRGSFMGKVKDWFKSLMP